jgi:hypothetical protein
LAKCAIEVGKITEPHIKRHRAEVVTGKVWIARALPSGTPPA